MSRSPKYPSLSLPDAIKYADQAYAKIGSASVDSATFVEAMGYSSISGASSKTFAALKYFNLAEGRGTEVKLTDLYLKISHPMNEGEKAKAIIEAGMKPEAFASLFREHDNLPPEDLLKSIAIRKLGFNESGAQKFVSNLVETKALMDRYKISTIFEDEVPTDDEDSLSVKSTEHNEDDGPHTTTIRNNASEHLKFKLSKDLEAEIYFYGDVNAESIKRLIKHLEFTSEIYV